MPPLERRRCRTMKHILYSLFLSAVFCGRAAAAVWLDSYSFPQSQPTSIRSDESFPGNYKLRAKFLNIPGYPDGFHAAMSENNNGFLLDMLPPPGTYSAEFYWVKYDAAWSVVEVGPQVITTVAIVAADVSLASTSFMSWQEPLPRIFTASNQVPFSPYKLRAKFIDPSSGTPIHAATSANNQDFPLDLSPPPGVYNTVSLYWVRYDASGNSVVQIGAEQTISAAVTQGTVALSSYYFTPYQRAAVTTDEPMAPGQNYRLRATFMGVAGYPNGFEAATADNNNGFPLDAVPPNGTYTVALKWTKYDANWANPQPGPETQLPVTVSDTLTVLNESGHIELNPIYDGSGNIIGYSSSTVSHDFHVPIAGTLRLRTNGWVDTTGSLYDADSQLLATAVSGGDFYNFEILLDVSPGWHRVSITGANAGDYQVIGEMGPPPPPTLAIIGGNNQSASAGQFNPEPLDVAVWNNAGTAPLVNMPIIFTVLQGGGRIATTNTGTPSLFSTLTLQTDVDGTAQVFFKQPATEGITSHVRALSGATAVTFTTLSITPGTLADSDADGLPDAWETQYFGNLGQAAASDPDGDGLTNLEEYQLGRNPMKGSLLDTSGAVNLRVYTPAQ
jgi:hypothetical protein